jgi:MFS family permease
MVTMIAVRIFGATVFDRLNKIRLIMPVLFLLMLCLIALPNTGNLSVYYLLAAVYGGCMGVALPILNALIFSASPPSLRGLNTNMTLFTMDMGYFITPYLGGTLITLGADFGTLFYTAGGFTLLCLSMIITLRYRNKG